MTEHEKYQEHIRHTHDAFCKTVIRHAAIDAARSIRSRRKREISLEYLIEEKHYPFSTTDKYFAEQAAMNSYPLFVCGQMVLLESPEPVSYTHLDVYKRQHVLSDLDQSDIEKFEAVIDSGEYTGSVHDLINLAQNLDCYDFYPGIDSEEALGRAYIEEMEMLDVPDNVLPYFDFEAYGRDARINDGGHFAPGGYVFNNGGNFVERYHGMAVSYTHLDVYKRQRYC